MAVKIRLQRHGKKNFAFFHIVVADSRSPRDGRYIEQIGSYNPNTNPATIVLNAERALAWLKVGAEPTLTARRILSYEGILLRHHLDGGRRLLTRSGTTGRLSVTPRSRPRFPASRMPPSRPGRLPRLRRPRSTRLAPRRSPRRLRRLLPPRRPLRLPRPPRRLLRPSPKRLPPKLPLRKLQRLPPRHNAPDRQDS